MERRAFLGACALLSGAALAPGAGAADAPPRLYARTRLVDADYAWVTGELMAVAARHAGGRIVSSLEGGYSLSALGRSAVEHVRTLLAE